MTSDTLSVSRWYRFSLAASASSACLRSVISFTRQISAGLPSHMKELSRISDHRTLPFLPSPLTAKEEVKSLLLAFFR